MTYSEPTEWNPTKATFPEGMYYYPYGDKSTGIVYVCFQSKPSAIGKLSDEYRTLIKATVKSEDMIEYMEDIQIAGAEAIKARVFLSVNGTGDYEALEYAFVDDKYVYSFVFGDKGELGENMISFADRMISTVSIGNGVNTDNTNAANASKSAEASTGKAENADKPTETVKTDTDANASGTTTGQKNAQSAAKSYLKVSAFSRDGLVDQLKYEGYSDAEAQYGADNSGADWNEQALKSAKSYLAISAFSARGLKEQLVYEKFSSSEAQYGVDNCGANWSEQAAKSAASYMSLMSFSKAELIEQLKYEGFTDSEAQYGANANGY